eukprot:6178105-Pleurochrysis_carterae.AAC.2
MVDVAQTWHARAAVGSARVYAVLRSAVPRVVAAQAAAAAPAVAAVCAAWRRAPCDLPAVAALDT